MTPQKTRKPEPSLSPSLEHYLRAIYELIEEKGYARVTDIAQQLGVAKPAVSAALKTLHASGMVQHRVYENVLLTEAGERQARGVSGKFAILIQFLSDILGVDGKQALVDACLMEHYVSGNTMDRILDLLRFFEDQKNFKALEAFQAFRRACEGEDTCPSCSFNCDDALAGKDAPPNTSRMTHPQILPIHGRRS
ncbi:MAG: metal-dependent transcriptional regulator [bacterium]|nr:metal-dependent transcriptional regulator [bacterium]